MPNYDNAVIHCTKMSILVGIAIGTLKEIVELESLSEQQESLNNLLNTLMDGIEHLYKVEIVVTGKTDDS